MYAERPARNYMRKMHSGRKCSSLRFVVNIYDKNAVYHHYSGSYGSGFVAIPSLVVVEVVVFKESGGKDDDIRDEAQFSNTNPMFINF